MGVQTMLTIDDVLRGDFADRVMQFIEQREIFSIADVLFVAFDKHTEELQYRVFDHHVVNHPAVWGTTFHPLFLSSIISTRVFLWVFIQSVTPDNGIHTLFEMEPMHPDRLTLLVRTLDNDVSRGYFLYRTLRFNDIRRYRDVLRFPEGVPYQW
jgi:hypothetical protein